MRVVSDLNLGSVHGANRRRFGIVAAAVALVLVSVTGMTPAQQQGPRVISLRRTQVAATRGNGGNTRPSDPQDNGASSDELPPPEPENTGENAGVHQRGVEALSQVLPGIFEGTGCSDGGGLCPNEEILRWEMAVWFVRALEGIDPRPTASRFTDVEDNVWWEAHVDRLRELGITVGCGTDPPRFCPNRSVSRAEIGDIPRESIRPSGSVTGRIRRHRRKRARRRHRHTGKLGNHSGMLHTAIAILPEPGRPPAVKCRPSWPEHWGFSNNHGPRPPDLGDNRDPVPGPVQDYRSRETVTSSQS